MSFWDYLNFLLKLLGVFGCPKLGALKLLLLPLFIFFDLFHYLILRIIYTQFKFMDIYCLKELHNTRSNDVVINKLESLILSTNMLQEIEVISDEKQRTKKEAVWKQ